MKIRVASDLHLERYHNSSHVAEVVGMPKNESDVLILSGDICEARLINNYVEYFQQLVEKSRHVIYIPGNHEYYSSETMAHAEDTLQEFCDRLGIKFLSNDIVDINRVRFIGSTMWATVEDMSKKYQELMSRWPDFRYTYFKEGVKQSVDTIDMLHRKCKKFLSLELDASHDDDSVDSVVVATHFPISWKFADKFFAKNPFNHFFYNSFDSWFQPGGHLDSPKVKLICGGHTHASKSLVHNGVRLICNPRGYYKRGELENPKFSWNSLKTSLEI